jgi:diadenosine tetraphosphate (Ap4A) HIT family hydrolase
MWRTRANQKKYTKYIASRPHPCDFCYEPTIKNQYIAETSHFWLLRSAYPYDTWDLGKVEEHLLVVPKRHVESLSKFSAKEGEEYFSIIAEFEGKGFSVYARAPGNNAKSIPHLHTHLFKLKGKAEFYLYLGKLNLMMFK